MARNKSGGYMATLMDLLHQAGQGTDKPVDSTPVDAAPYIHSQDPYSSFAVQSQKYGMNPFAQGDQFTDWANGEGFARTQAQYKAAISANPYMTQGHGGDYHSFIGNQGQSMVDDIRNRYRALTPQQRGINSATGYKTGRWAVY